MAKSLIACTGYGGFMFSTPSFSASELFWLEWEAFMLWSICAVVENMGKMAPSGDVGKKAKRLDDLIATAEWLIKSGYTSPAKLAIEGGSNGGLLVGATLLQRPDLFGAAVCQVPVLDMLRYHLFTVGRYWVGEYGNAIENPAHFQFFFSLFSPAPD